MSAHTTIVRIIARDFQGLRAARVKLTDAGLVRVTGKNGSGKSSLLRAISAALGGAAEVHVRAVNDASADGTAEVELELSNGFRIRRKLTEANPKGYLAVIGPDGGKYGQGKLDDLVGPLSFDPLAFFGLKPARQAEILLSLGSDPELAAKLEASRRGEAEIYNARTPWISKQRAAAKVPKPEGAKPERIDVSAEMTRLRELQARDRDLGELKSQLATCESTARRRLEAVEDAEAAVEKARAALRMAEAEVVHRRNLFEEAENEAATLSDEIAEYADPAPEIEEVAERIEAADRVALELMPWRAWEEAQRDNAEAADRVVELTHELEAAAAARHAMIADAGIPIAGLSFDEHGAPMLHGRPLELASGGERIRLAVEVALAVDPALGICLVDEANDLDLDALRALHDEAMARGFQLVVCRIGLEGDGEVMVADGVALSDGETLEEPEEVDA